MKVTPEKTTTTTTTAKDRRESRKQQRSRVERVPPNARRELSDQPTKTCSVLRVVWECSCGWVLAV